MTTNKPKLVSNFPPKDEDENKQKGRHGWASTRGGMRQETSHAEMLEMTWKTDCEGGIVMGRAKDVDYLTSHMLR